MNSFKKRFGLTIIFLAILLGNPFSINSLFAGRVYAQIPIGSIDVIPGNSTINVGQTQEFTARGAPAVISLATGSYHTCALLSDGTVHCWGLGNNGQLGNGTMYTNASTPVTVIGITTAVAVTAGGDYGSSYSCALLLNGTIQCWGSAGQLGDGTTASSSTPVTVSGITNAIAVSAGGDHTCALLLGGTIQCWGRNYAGELGNGTTTDSLIPVTVSGITTAIAVSAGGAYTCAVLADGSVQCWGSNDYGQIGNAVYNYSTMPIGVGITNATAVAAGDQHTCALITDSTVQCWGYNNFGELGNSTGYTIQRVPLTARNITTATAITANREHTCAVLTDHTVQCWGYNGYGQLGNGTTTSPYPPANVSGITTATLVEAGDLHTCAVLTDHTVQCWGYNALGELGNGTFSDSLVPVGVSGLTGVVSDGATSLLTGVIWSSSNPAVAVVDATGRTTGLSPGTTIISATSNSGGGSATLTVVDVPVTTTILISPQNPTIIVGQTQPFTASGPPNAITLAAGAYHTCALLSDHTVQCWGWGINGQLGNGSTTINASTPVTVIGITTAVGVSAAASYTCALLSDGTVQCWGQGYSSTPVSVTGITTAIALSAGGDHTCVLLLGGTIQCWGTNYAGQLGDGTTTTSLVPVAVSGITTAIALSAGYSHTCTVLADGTVQCWGRNDYGQIGNAVNSYSTTPVGVGITNATAIASGHQHTCALITGGTIQCWGWNIYGQLGGSSGGYTIQPVPVTVQNITTATAITADRQHTCAVLVGGSVQCWGFNGYGQLGNGTTMSTGTPTVVSGIAMATFVEAGDLHTCAVLTGGTVQCWGYNGWGELGNGTFFDSLLPVGVSGLSGIVWTSIDPSVATINGNGLATGLNPGTTTIAASFGIFSGITTLTVNIQTATLSLITTGTGSGTLIGAGTYPYNQTATVSATANTGSTFAGWSGPNGTECATGSVVMTADKSCTATFTLNTYTLLLAPAGTGSGILIGAGTYPYNQTATVSATANAGSTFAGWSGPNGTECATGSVAMTADKSCTATFTLNTYTLTLATAGTGSGTVNGAGTYNYNQTATVLATANAGSTFVGWSGPNAAECATGSMVMTADKSCTATFNDTVPPSGTIVINGNAAWTNTPSVSLTLTCTDTLSGCSQMQFSNDNVTFTALEPFATSKAWTLPAGDGTKAVYVRYTDVAGNLSGTFSDSIVLDTTRPVVSGVSDSPDPFRPSKGQSTTISFTVSDNLSVTCNARVRIFDLSGTLVRTITKSGVSCPAGGAASSVIWNGKNGSGVLVPSGTYVYVIQAIDLATNLSLSNGGTTNVR